MKGDSRKYEAPYNPVFDEDEYFDSTFLHFRLKSDDYISEVNSIIRGLPRKLRRGYRGSFLNRELGSRPYLELAVDYNYKMPIINHLESQGYVVDLSNASYLEAEDDDLMYKIETLKGGIMAFQEDKRLSTDKYQKSYFEGMATAFESVIRGLERVGIDKTLEEVTAVLRPNSLSNWQILHDNNMKDTTYYYQAGKLAGYDEAVEYLSPFGISFQDSWQAEQEEIDINIISPKEAKLNIWIPLMVGFIGGTFATVVGNIWSEMWLKTNGHSRSVEMKPHQNE